MTETVAPEGAVWDEYTGNAVREALSQDRYAAGKIKELNRALEEWKAYRKGKQEIVRRALAGRTKGFFNGELLVTDEPKDQFSGGAFAEKYPTLAAEFTVPQTVEVLDVAALREAHPDIAAEFTVRTFTNKLAA